MAYDPEASVVPRGGIEPPTHGFSVRCSTRLKLQERSIFLELVANQATLVAVRNFSLSAILS
jgi:hypothetical protein